MKTLGCFAVLLLIVFIPACVRRHQCTSHLRVKTVYNALRGYTSTYTYNQEGILTEISTTKGSKTIITYTDNLVTGKTSDKSEKVTSTWICFLNKRGLVDSLVKSDSTKITATKKFIYDANGFAIEEHESKPGQAYTITRKTLGNGNVISYIVMHVEPYVAKITYNPVTKTNDTVSITTTGKEYTVYSEYFTDKIKTLAFQNYGSPEFGEGAKNIEKRTVQISPEGDTIEVSLFKYTFDEHGKATMCVTRNQSGELLDSSYITYYP